MDHGAMESGLMTGMLVAGFFFSLIPLIVAVAFGVFLIRQAREDSRGRIPPPSTNQAAAARSGGRVQ